MNEAARKAELERALSLLRAGKDPGTVLERCPCADREAPARADQELAGSPAPLDLR
jgi:hypothetical protein